MCSIFHFFLHFPAFLLAITNGRGGGSKRILANFSAGINQQHPLVFNRAMQLYTVESAPTVLLKSVPLYKELCFLRWCILKLMRSIGPTASQSVCSAHLGRISFLTCGSVQSEGVLCGGRQRTTARCVLSAGRGL